MSLALDLWQCWSTVCLLSLSLCVKLDTCVGAAADRDASPACLNHLPSSLPLSPSPPPFNSYTCTRTCTGEDTQADNSRVATVTQEVCSLSPDPATNQVDNYAYRLYFSHVAFLFKSQHDRVRTFPFSSARVSQLTRVTVKAN